MECSFLTRCIPIVYGIAAGIGAFIVSMVMFARFMGYADRIYARKLEQERILMEELKDFEDKFGR